MEPWLHIPEASSLSRWALDICTGLWAQGKQMTVMLDSSWLNALLYLQRSIKFVKVDTCRFYTSCLLQAHKVSRELMLQIKLPLYNLNISRVIYILKEVKV